MNWIQSPGTSRFPPLIRSTAQLTFTCQMFVFTNYQQICYITQTIFRREKMRKLQQQNLINNSLSFNSRQTDSWQTHTYIQPPDVAVAAAAICHTDIRVAVGRRMILIHSGWNFPSIGFSTFGQVLVSLSPFSSRALMWISSVRIHLSPPEPSGAVGPDI